MQCFSRLTCLNTWFPAAGAVWEVCGTFWRETLSRESGSLGGPWGAGVPVFGHFVPPVCWCSVMNWSSALVPCFLHCGGYHPPGAGDHNKPFLLKLDLSRYLTTTRRKIRHFPEKLSLGPRGFTHEISLKTLPNLEGERHFLTHSLMLVLLTLNPSPVSFMSTHDPQHVISKLNPWHVLKPTHRTKWHLP